MAFWDKKQNEPTYHEPSIDDFHTKNWNKLSENERLDALQHLEDRMALEQGRTPRQVFPDDRLGSGQCGYYSENNPTHIYINRDYLQSSKNGSQYDAMNTVIHEGRHAYQDDCINGRPHNGSPENVDIWKKNFDSDVYNNPGNTLQERLNYRYQPVEEDANNFARSKMEDFSDKFSSDRNYSKYMNNEAKINKKEDIVAKNEMGADYKQTISDDINRRYDAKHQNGEAHGNLTERDNFKSIDTQKANAPNTSETVNWSPNAKQNDQTNQNNNAPSNKDISSERGQKSSSDKNVSQNNSTERGSKSPENANASQNNNTTTRGEKPQEGTQNASNAQQTQKGTPPGASGGEDSRAKTSSSSDHSDKISASNNSAKAADEASKVASEQAAQNVAPKPNGMGM